MVRAHRARDRHDPRLAVHRIKRRNETGHRSVSQAQRLRARAARYREFAALSCDEAARRTRLTRAANFERLADELQGLVRKKPATAASSALAPLAAPFATLWRALGRASMRSGQAAS